MGQLDEILARHKRWLETGGAEGARADFAVTADTYPYLTRDDRIVNLPFTGPRRDVELREALRSRGLAGLDLTRASFARAELDGVDCTGATLRETNWTDASFSNAQMEDVDLTAANLLGARFSGARLSRARFDGANLTEAKFDDSELRQTSFRSAILERAVATNADLSEADFTDAVMSGADLKGANLAAAKLGRAKLQSAQMRGVRAAHADFSDASLANADLSEGDLASTTLTRTDLHACLLYGTSFQAARAAGATFSLVRAEAADFTGADLVSSSFSGADLQRVTMDSAILKFVDFREAALIDGSDEKKVQSRKPTVLTDVVWGKADLSWIRIDMPGLAQIPPQVLHAFRHKMNIETEAIAGTQVFICHAHEDSAVADEIYDRLVAEGFSPWLDKRDLRPGQEWRREIPLRIRASDAVIICFSSIAVSKRGYVQNEFRLALEELRQMPAGRIFVIPIRINDCEVPLEFESLQYVEYWAPNAMQSIVDAIRSIQ